MQPPANRERSQMWLWCGLACLVCIVVLPSVAHAGTLESLDPGPFTRILQITRQQAQHWTGKLQDAARPVFWALAGIQLLWVGITQLTSGQTSLPAMAGAYARAIVTISCFSLLLEHGPEWGQDLVEKLRALGRLAAAETGATVPQVVVDDAIELCVREFASMSILDQGATVLATLMGLFIVLLLFAVIGAILVLAEVQAYVILGAGAITLAFGGSSWTRPLALAYMRHAFGSGLKLMLIELMQSVVLGHLQGWVKAGLADNGNLQIETLATMLVSAVVLSLMLITLPDKLAAIVTGSVGATAEAIVAGGAAAAALKSTVSAGASAKAAAEKALGGSSTAKAAAGGASTAGAAGATAAAPAATAPLATAAGGGTSGGGTGGESRATVAASQGGFAASAASSAGGDSGGSGAGGSESSRESGSGGGSPYARFAPAPPSTTASSSSEGGGSSAASRSTSSSKKPGSPSAAGDSKAKGGKDSNVAASAVAGDVKASTAQPGAKSASSAARASEPTAAPATPGAESTASAKPGGGGGASVSTEAAAQSATGGGSSSASPSSSAPAAGASGGSGAVSAQASAARSAFGVQSSAAPSSPPAASAVAAAIGHGGGYGTPASRGGNHAQQSVAMAARSSTPSATSMVTGGAEPAPGMAALAPAASKRPSVNVATSAARGPTATQVAARGGSHA